jgi:hypothetical protein
VIVRYVTDCANCLLLIANYVEEYDGEKVPSPARVAQELAACNDPPGRMTARRQPRHLHAIDPASTSAQLPQSTDITPP